MAFSKIKDGGVVISSYGVKIPGASSYICEGDDDIPNLPTTEVIGSTCLVIPTGDVYILGPSRTWQLYKGISILGDN